MTGGGVAPLLEAAGIPASAAGRATISGRDPVLATPLPIAQAAASALAACASAVAHCWALRTGEEQDVEVAVPRAAAALLSHALQRLDGTALHPPADPLNGLFQTRDGRWIQLLGAFPHLSQAALGVLGCGHDPEAIAAAVARWDGDALEDALAAAGAVGALARRPEEWRRHPQGRALRGAGPIEIVRIGRAPREPFGDGSRPLGGVRVLELTRILAGPSCGKLLAEHGADVLGVSSPSLPNPLTCILDTGPGKLATLVDLDEPDGDEELRELAAHCDVFVQGYRSGALERRGFGPSALADLRPGVIYVTINTYGDYGPWRGRRGWEPLAEAAAGIAIAGAVDGRPRALPAAACDYTTGFLAALGTIGALLRRAREGGSWLVRASLCQTAMWLEALGPRLDPGAATGLGDVDPWMIDTETLYGRLRHLAPVAQLSATPGHWARPVAPPGTHPPAWPARGQAVV